MGNSLIKLTQRNRNKDNSEDNNRNRTQGNGENSNGMPVVGSSHEIMHVLSSPIFELNGHCFDEIFEYLSLKELHSLGQTCKSMQQMTGEFFTRNYSTAEFICLGDGVCLKNYRDKLEISEDTLAKCVRVPGFIHLITRLAIEHNVVVGYNWISKCHQVPIYDHDMSKFEYIKLHADELKSVKKLSLRNVRINKQTVDYIRNILPNIEVLGLIVCTVYQDLYDVLLKYCKKSAPY